MYMKMIAKYIRDSRCETKLTLVGMSLVSLVLFQACNDAAGTDHIGDGYDDSNLSFDLKDVMSDIVDNTSLYVFNPSYNYHHKQLNVTRGENENKNVLSTRMTVGVWNLIMLACNTDIADQIVLPTYGDPTNVALWKTGTEITPEGEFLKQTPELRYTQLNDVIITAGQTVSKTARLDRNVAMIEIVLEDRYNGFDAINEENKIFAYAELYEVPTTIRWDGTLSYVAADISSKPIREYFTFKPDGKADTLRYIIPADRLATSLDPLTAHKLKMRVSMPINNRPFYGKSVDPIEIEFVPQPNGIIRVDIISFKGEPASRLDVKVTAKPWEDYIHQEEEFN